MRYFLGPFSILLSSLLIALTPAAGEEIDVVVTLQNLAAEELIIGSPWVGFQDGGFDVYDPGSGPSRSLSQLVKGGDPRALAEEFAASGRGSVGAVLQIFGGALAAGERTSQVFHLDTKDETSRFLVFAASLSRGQGRFIVSDNPVAYPIVDESGAFTGTSILITADQVFSSTEGDTGNERLVGDLEAQSRITDLDGAEDSEAGPTSEPLDDEFTAGSRRDETGGLGVLELARITVRPMSKEGSEEVRAPLHPALAGFPHAHQEPIGSASAAGSPATVGAQTESGVEIGEGLEEEDDDLEDEDLELDRDESIEDLKLDRWERYSAALDAEADDGEPEDSDDDRSSPLPPWTHKPLEKFSP